MNPSDSSQGSIVRLPSLGALFQQSWTLYKSKLLTLLLLMLVGVLVGFLVAGIPVASMFFLSRLTALWKIPAILSLMLLLFLMVLYVICRFQLAFIIAVVRENCGVREAIQLSKNRVASFFWLGGITSFLVIGGYLFFVIPGILFTVWFFFGAFVFVAEELKGMSCLSRSRFLVAGRWWAVTARLFIVWLLSLVISAIPFMGPILAVLFGPFATIFSFVLYQGIKKCDGDLVYQPAGKSQWGVWLVSILGYLVLPTLFFFSIFVFFPGAVAQLQKLIISGSSQAVSAVQKNQPSQPSLSVSGAAPSNAPLAKGVVAVPTPSTSATNDSMSGTVEVVLKSGQKIQGRVVEENASGFWLEVGYGARVRLEREEIDVVREKK